MTDSRPVRFARHNAAVNAVKEDANPYVPFRACFRTRLTFPGGTFSSKMRDVDAVNYPSRAMGRLR